MAKVMHGRIFGILALVIQICFLIAYGFSGKIFPQTSAQKGNTTWAFNYIITAVLTILGYGLILSYYKFSVLSSFFKTLFIVSFTTLFCPLLLRFWHNVFIFGFNNNEPVTMTNFENFEFLFYNGTNSISPSYYLMRLTLFCSISQLVMISAIIGRIGVLQTLTSSVVFNVAWTFSLILNISIHRRAPNLKIMDDFFISNIYLFGAIFGLIVAIFSRKTSVPHQEFATSRMSTIIALMGTFFVYLSFSASSALFPLKTSGNQFGHNGGAFNIFLSMSASTISTIAISLIVSEKFNIRSIIWSTIMGGVLFGSVSNTVEIPGGAIAIGTFAGIFSSLFYQYIFNRFRQNYIWDSHGILGTFLINSFVGTAVCAPIIIIAMYNTGITWGTVGLLQSKLSAGDVLIFFILSLIFGAIGGLLAGLLVKCISSKQDNQQDYRNTLILSADYGLGKANGNHDFVKEQNVKSSKEKEKSVPSVVMLKFNDMNKTPSGSSLVKNKI